MGRATGRKPVGNFFVKKGLQIGLITRIAAATVVSTLIAANTIVLVYYLQNRSVLLYRLPDSGSLSKQNIFDLILPSLVISITINIILAVCIGLYASRKYAVPVYKLEQWAGMLRAGKLNAILRFREQREMSDICDQFNALTGELRAKFLDVKKLIVHVKSTHANDEQLKRVEEMLAGMELSVKPAEGPGE